MTIPKISKVNLNNMKNDKLDKPNTSILNDEFDPNEATETDFDATLFEENSFEITVEEEPLEDKKETTSEPEFDGTTSSICRLLASNYVRKEGKFLRVSDPTESMSMMDMKRVVVGDLEERHPTVEISEETWRDAFQHAIETVHSDRSQTISVWNGKVECMPQEEKSIVWSNGMTTINSWSVPAYRTLDVQEADSALFDELLSRMFVQQTDRIYIKDWLSWCLQNEANKPGWAILLYSQTKGTGKSTLLQTLALLFGEANSFPANGLQKVTAKFNQTVMSKKFIACEEVKLKPGTDAGNVIKSIITEPRVAVEGKGKEATEVRSVTVFAMTTNHYPHWIEPDDRRWYVADANHSGHASGPDSEDFQSFIAHYQEQLANPEELAKLYNALMQHKQSNTFNARSLKVSVIDTPIMKRINAASGEVLQQELSEILEGQALRAVPQTKLRRLFVETLKANANRIPHMMSELGWNPQKAKWGGADYARAIWVHPDFQVSNGRVTGPDGYDEAVDAGEDGVEII